MIWVSQDFLNELRKLLGAGDDLTADNLMERLAALKERADKATSATMSLSRDALATEAQLEADVAGLKSLVALKKGLLGLGSATKKTTAQGPDKESGKAMLLAAGGEKKG